jgi:hypothetical protein
VTSSIVSPTPDELVLEPHPAVSWGAVFAGAAAALALLMLLVTLGAGFGLKLAPWLASRDSLSAFTPIAGATMIAAQVVSAALGGYLAGRLRTHWLNVHAHEVHFRDTAHGLLVWAVSTLAGLLMAALLALGAPATDAGAAGVAAEAASDPVLAQRIANVAAQAAFFTGFGMLLSAFIAAVAAAIGGIRRDEMHGER